MMPNAAFGLLVSLASSLAVSGPVSVAVLLMTGGNVESLPSHGIDLTCLLVPTGSDWTVHGLSYALFVAVMIGAGTGTWSLIVEQWRTQRLVERCLAASGATGEATRLVARRVGLNGRLDVVAAADPACFTHGLVRPRVCISSGLLDALEHAELEAVLRHERYHVRHYDPLRIMLGRALVSAFFFVPILRDLFLHYRLHVELAADRAAVEQMRERHSLASALDKLLDRRAIVPSTLPGIAHGNGLEARIDSLVGDPVRACSLARLSSLVISALPVLLLSLPTLSALTNAEPRLLTVLAWAPHAPCW